LRVCFGEAVRRGLRAVNPAVRVPILKTRDKSARRAFTLSEIKRILKACGDGAEWRGLVLFGLYLGQRVGDLARLTWRAVNLESGEIAFTTRKTGRRIVLPLVQPLADYLASLPVRFLEVVSNYFPILHAGLLGTFDEGALLSNGNTS